MARKRSPRDLTDGEFDRLFSERLERSRAEERELRYKGVSPKALLWMALSPGWTLPMAEACRFPSGKKEPVDVLKGMRESGWIEVDKPISKKKVKEEQVIYFMDKANQAEILDNYLRIPRAFPRYETHSPRLGGDLPRS